MSAHWAVLPIKKEKGEDSGEVGRGGVGWQVEHKQNNNTACGGHKVVKLRRDERQEHGQPHSFHSNPYVSINHVDTVFSPPCPICS